MSETVSCYVQVVVFGLPWRAVPSVSAQPGCAAAPQCWSSRPHCGRQPYTPRGAPFWSRGRPAWWFPDMRPSDSETESPALPGWRASWRTASDLVRGRVDSISFTDIDFYIYMAAGRRAAAENNRRRECHQSQEADKVHQDQIFPQKNACTFLSTFKEPKPKSFLKLLSSHLNCDYKHRCEKLNVQNSFIPAAINVYYHLVNFSSCSH